MKTWIIIGICVVSVILLLLIIRFIYEWRNSSSDEGEGILARAGRIGRGACSKLKEKLFGC